MKALAIVLIGAGLIWLWTATGDVPVMTKAVLTGMLGAAWASAVVLVLTFITALRRR